MKYLILSFLLLSTVAFAGPKKPVAVAKVTPVSGYLPLSLELDGTGSYDTDGTIVSYTWTLPDNTVKTGATATHILKAGKKKQKIDLKVVDNAGKSETDKVQIEILDDNTNPSLSLDVPDTITVSNDTPTFTAFYSDPQSKVDLNKVFFYFDNVDVTNHSVISDNHAVLQFTKAWPMVPGQHTLKVFVSDYYGNSTFKSVSITYVNQQVTKHYLNGKVIDKDGNPISNVQVFDVNGPVGSRISGATNNNGEFSIPFTMGGDYALKFTKDGYLDTFKYKTLLTGKDDYLDTVYVAVADTKQTFIDAAAGGVATNSTNSITVVIPPGSIDSSKTLSFTEAKTGKTLAVPLPNGSQFTYAQNNQPSGTTFSTPADVSIKNILGFPAGTEIPVGITNEELGVWEDSGFKGVVNTDATLIDFKLAHFSDDDVNLNTNAPDGQVQKNPDPNKTKETGNPPNKDCPECGDNSRANPVSNDLLLDYEFPSVMRRGKSFNLGITYSSVSVVPTMLVAARNRDQFGATSPDKIEMVTYAAGKQQTKVYEKKTLPGTATFVAAIDMTSPDGYSFGTHTTNTYVNLRSQNKRYFANTPYFGGPAGSTILVGGKSGGSTGGGSYAPIETPEPVWLEEGISDRQIHINNIDSRFGAGWTVNGNEKLSINTWDGVITFEDGTGYSSYFIPGAVVPDSRIIQRRVGPEVQNLHYSKGFFYGTSCEENDVFRIDLKGRYTSILSNNKNKDLNLSCPTSVFQSRRGGFYIADSGNGRILYLDQTGNVKTVAGHNDKSRLDNPTFVSEDNVLALHIVDGNSIKTLSPYDGSILDLISENSNYFKFKLKKPTQIHYDDKFNFMVLDEEKGQLVKFFINGGDSRILLKDLKGIKGMTYDTILKRYYLFKDNGEVFAWDGVGDDKLIPIDIRTGTVTGLAKEYSEKNRKNISSLSYSPEIGLVYADDQGINISVKGNKKGKDSILNYTPSLNEYSLLQKLADGTFKRTLRDNTVVTYDVDGFIQERIFTDGSKFIYERDPNSKLLMKVHVPGGGFYSFTYYGFGLLNKVIDPVGRVTELFYDSNSNVIEIRNPEGDSQHFTYDSKHLITSHTYESGGTKTYTHRLGRIQKVTMPDGTVREFKNTLIDALYASPNEAQEFPTFFSKDGIVQITSPEGRSYGFILDTFGVYSGIIDGDGNRTYVDRNSDSRPLEETSAEGRKNFADYDILGRKTENRDGNGLVKFTYDPVHQKIATIQNEFYQTALFWYTPTGQLQGMKDFSGLQTNYIYNADNTLASVNDSYSSISYDRDEYGNVVGIKDPSGQKTLMVRDGAGNIISSKDPLGNITNFSYDGLNRVSEILDAKSGKTTFEYTGIGDLTSVTDAEGHQTHFVYNEKNKVTKIVNPLNQEVNFTYDLDNNILSKITKANQTINFSYDNNNQLVSKQLPNDQVNFIYDKDSLLIEMNDSDSSVARDFDLYNRLTEEKSNHYSGKLRYNYNQIGQVKQSSLLIGNNNAITSMYTYDPNGNLTANDTYFFGKKVSFSKVVDLKGRTTRINYPNGSNTVMSYDSSSRMVDQTTNIPGVHYMDYRYTANGNISIVYEEINQISRSNRYDYDELSRLSKEQSIKSQSFTYDGVGNNSANGGTFNELNQLLEDANFTYTYDLNGNQKKKTNKVTGAHQDFTWNAENQLQNVKAYKDASTIEFTISYKYDASGRRIQRSVENHTAPTKSYVQKFIYDGQSLIAITDANDNFVAGYMYDDGIDQPVALVTDYNKDGEIDILSIVRDRQNSVKLLVNEKQEIVQEVSYSAYGETQIINRGQGNPKLNNIFYYTSRELEPELGIYYYRARYYDPGTGRFLSEDPLGLASGDVNLYRYTQNRPVLTADPSGQFTFFFAAANFYISLISSHEVYLREKDIVRFTSMIDNNSQRIKQLKQNPCENEHELRFLYDQNDTLREMRKELRREQKDVIVMNLATMGLGEMASYALSYLSAF